MIDEGGREKGRRGGKEEGRKGEGKGWGISDGEGYDVGRRAMGVVCDRVRKSDRETSRRETESVMRGGCNAVAGKKEQVDRKKEKDRR